AFSQAVTEFKNIVLKGELNTPMPPAPAPPPTLSFEGGQLPAIEARTRQYAAIIKAHPDYTPSIGEDYGIVAPAAPPAGVPSLTATALTASQVRLGVTKA